MKVKDIKDYLNDLPDDANVVISSPFVMDKNEEIVAILDIPVVGMVFNDDENEKELRFILHLEGVKSCFSPDQVVFLNDEEKKEITGESE